MLCDTKSHISSIYMHKLLEYIKFTTTLTTCHHNSSQLYPRYKLRNKNENEQDGSVVTDQSRIDNGSKVKTMYDMYTDFLSQKLCLHTILCV